MSDDEYYANSNYDDYDDQIWDDAGDDIAGDLAEHAVYSPVYQYEPSYELLQGFSDWEYYSDDYYDDDPCLLGPAAQGEGFPTSSERVSRQPGDITKPGKKRKLDEMQDIPADRKTLDQCIKGTVWAEKESVARPFYQEGEIGKVALLGEWRKVFKETKRRGNSGSTSRKRGLQREDPWANMSLQDMGLATAPRRSTSGAADVEGGIRADEEELDLSQVPEEVVVDEWAEVYDDEGDDRLADTEDVSRHRKPQRTNDFMQPPPTKKPARSEHHLDAEPSPEPAPHNTNGLERRKQSGDKENRSENSDSVITHLIVSAPVDLVQVKKRRASGSDDEKEVKSTIKSRAKRVASSKLSTKKDTALEEVPPIPSRRVTRNRKKA